jgi:hypothetical protein
MIVIMDEPLTPAERWLLATFLEVAERFGEEMSVPIRLVRRDLELGLSSGHSRSLVEYARMRKFRVITSGVARDTDTRLAPSQVNSNAEYQEAASEGSYGLGSLTMNFLGIGWRNFSRLRSVDFDNPFDTIYVSGETFYARVDHAEVSEATLLSFLVWFVGICCEDRQIQARYMATIVYSAQERTSRVEFEFDSNDPGIVGLLLSHGQPVPPHLLN